MRLIGKLLKLVLLLAGGFLLGGWLLPDHAVVERSIVIERPPAEVFALLDGFERFNEWSPWRERDPGARYEYAGPPRGPGAEQRWRGEQGEGAQRIVAVDPPHSVSLALDFGAQGRATTHYLLRPAGAGTRLVWRLHSDAEGSLSRRWLNLLLDHLLGADLGRGLVALKALAEAEPSAPPPSIEPAPQEPDGAAPLPPAEDEADTETAEANEGAASRPDPAPQAAAPVNTR